MYVCIYVRWRVSVLHYQDRGGGTARDSTADAAVSDQLLHDGSAGVGFAGHLNSITSLSSLCVYRDTDRVTSFSWYWPRSD